MQTCCLGQAENAQHTTQTGEAVQTFISTNRTETIGVVDQACGHADTGPTTNTRQDADVLFAVVTPGVNGPYATAWG